MNTIVGNCFCGQVRYEIAECTPKATVCHCAGCRHASAAPAVAWITVLAETFRLVQGELRTVRVEGLAKDTCDGWGGTRGFCPNCGTHITYVGDDRQEVVDITTGSLADPNQFPPTEECFAEKRLPWVKAFVE